MSNVMNDEEYRSLLQYFFDLDAGSASFNKFLNHSVESMDFDNPCIKFEARDDFVGNVVYRILHGGVIAAMLDTVGGHAVWLSVFKQIRGQPLENQIKRVRKIGSIDLRIDYLQPGKGKEFFATASILRTGRKVAVTRMELRNEKDLLIAVGTGSYLVG